MADPTADALAAIQAELTVVREQLQVLIGEVRANRRRSGKRRRTVAERARSRAAVVPVSEVDMQFARNALRRARGA